MVGSAPNSDCNWFYIKSVRVGSPLVANCEVILDENISMVRAPASRFYLIGNKVDRSAERVTLVDAALAAEEARRPGVVEEDVFGLPAVEQRPEPMAS